VFACVSALVLAALVYPLLRRGRAAVLPAEHDLAVYRDQLAELERDAAVGHISSADAEAARNEISRRMLTARAAVPVTQGASASRQRAGAALALVLVPGLAAAAYAINGRPDMPAVPLADRLGQAVERGDFPAMVARVEQHLQANPNDANGWAVLGPAYRRLGRDADAAAALTQLIRINGPNADVFADLGEALVAANGGLVSAQARTAFDEALKLDAKQPKARFYRTLADEQSGDRAKALANWKALLAETPADASWKGAVEQRIAALENPAAPQSTPAPAPGAAPGATRELPAGAEATQQLPADQQQAMIRGMVDRLDERLKQNGNDLEGWLRLARARAVLGERDRATAALEAAATHFKDDASAMAQIDEARRTLGLN
jgi:cytochrome c-type biogenesis protein CcmH